ncbi:MAG: hypothetical protein Kilf2KO_09620 [Rhodospirillales bacterium]
MADRELIKEELGRVYDLYGAQLRAFRRLLYGLIVTGLAVFAIVVVPFLTFRDQLAVLQVREQQQALDRQQAVERLSALQADLETVATLEREFRAFAEQHRSWEHYQALFREAQAHDRDMESLRQGFLRHGDAGVVAWAKGRAERPPEAAIAGNRQLFSLDQRPCVWKSGVAHVACRICMALAALDRRNAARLQRLSVATASQEASAVADRACAWLDRGAPHWRLERPLDARNPGRLRGMVTEDLKAYGQVLAEIRGSLRDRVPLAETEIARLERGQAITAERLTTLEIQLSRIASFDRLGTPIGDLPVGLGQLVLLFPLVMALAYVVVANSFTRLAALRSALARLCAKRDAGQEVMDARHVAVIAPLWLDRDEPLGARIVKIIILTLPLLLIVANLALIHDTRALAEQLPDDAAISPEVYLGLYALSLVLALGALAHVLRAGMRDSTGGGG